MGTLLSACGGGSNGETAELTLARPDNPVTWQLFDDNPAIASGLEPESGTLRIYNWNGYLWPRIKKDFAKEYGVKVEETYFVTMDEAISKISSGAVDYDVFIPVPDRLGRLVVGKVLQPLNHDYLPNLANAWPSVQDPWYDKGSLYTAPYLMWTTGIGYRTDKLQTTPLDLDNPYEIYWDEANRGKTYLLDDSRDAAGHMLLKNGIEDINTEDPAHIEHAKEELKSLIPAVNVKLSTDDYTNLPEGRAWVHQTWSGSAISAQWYLPEGLGPEALGFWFPEDGKGTIGNDLMAIPKSAKNPVLAHHFINYLLDVKHGYDNFANFVGYQPAADRARSRPAGQGWRRPHEPEDRDRPRERLRHRLLPDGVVRGTARLRGRTPGPSSRRVSDPEPSGKPSVAGTKGKNVWAGLALPGVAWLCLFFLLPLYAILAVAFGTVDPLFLEPDTGVEPALLEHGLVRVRPRRPVHERSGVPDRLPADARVRRHRDALSLLIAYPVAYYVARYGGRWKGLLLAGLIAPFFISYLMRMLAWINLLRTTGG